MEHFLKTWPGFFQAIKRGEKKFEIRENDRSFKVGDILKLWEFDHKYETYSGEFLHAKVSYVFEGGMFGIEEGYCVMSIDVISEGQVSPLEK